MDDFITHKLSTRESVEKLLDDVRNHAEHLRQEMLSRYHNGEDVTGEYLECWAPWDYVEDVQTAPVSWLLNIILNRLDDPGRDDVVNLKRYVMGHYGEIFFEFDMVDQVIELLPHVKGSFFSYHTLQYYIPKRNDEVINIILKNIHLDTFQKREIVKICNEHYPKALEYLRI